MACQIIDGRLSWADQARAIASPGGEHICRSSAATIRFSEQSLRNVRRPARLNRQRLPPDRTPRDGTCRVAERLRRPVRRVDSEGYCSKVGASLRTVVPAAIPGSAGVPPAFFVLIEEKLPARRLRSQVSAYRTSNAALIASFSSAAFVLSSIPINRINRSRGTVRMLSRFATHWVGRPWRRPKTTSEGIPRTVRVTRATTMESSEWRTASRVRITTGLWPTGEGSSAHQISPRLTHGHPNLEYREAR